MAAKQKKLAELVDKSNIEYATNVRGYITTPIATYAPSTKKLTIAKTLIQSLKLEDWKAVMVGLDSKSGIIVLRKCDVEEYGAVGVQDATAYKKGAGEYPTGSKTVYIGHMLSGFSFIPAKHYRVEREGNILYLGDIEK